ncbi:hypothetical protein [Paenibacillus faecalis]|uniref:hypothetical protein n=1 Tax=Paenibacillus faecalis TaxID=2079532 RepID=UPI000D107E54|nr:hypothetical protein [Paenibacillus faecalis]
MSLKKRERRVPVGARTMKQYPELTFDQAIDLVIVTKRTEGLRERTLADYKKHFGYFVDWVREFHPISNTLVN